MEAIVVDCSVAAAFVLREESGKTFDECLLHAAAGRVSLHAPPLLAYEMLNVLAMAQRRKRMPAGKVRDARHAFDRLPLQYDGAPSAVVRARIQELADQHRITAYDACYLELAHRLQARLLTLDRDLLKLKRLYPWIE